MREVENFMMLYLNKGLTNLLHLGGHQHYILISIRPQTVFVEEILSV